MPKVSNKVLLGDAYVNFRGTQKSFESLDPFSSSHKTWDAPLWSYNFVPQSPAYKLKGETGRGEWLTQPRLFVRHYLCGDGTYRKMNSLAFEGHPKFFYETRKMLRIKNAYKPVSKMQRFSTLFFSFLGKFCMMPSRIINSCAKD